MIELIDGFKKIYSLNGYKINETTILNKYMPFKYLKENIKNNQIVFVSPKTWQDPFEQIYYTAENFEKYNYKKPNIFCMCLTENSRCNEAAAWEMYRSDRAKIIQIRLLAKKLIQVRFWTEKMLKQLDKFCQEQNFSIYIGNTNYCFEKLDAIATLYESTNLEHDKYFPDKNYFSIDNFLNLLLLKRVSFKFENETRIFLVPEDNNASCCQNIYRMPFEYNDAIYKVKLAPQQYFTLLEDLKQKYYNNALKKLLPQDKIELSELYKPGKIIKL